MAREGILPDVISYATAGSLFIQSNHWTLATSLLTHQSVSIDLIGFSMLMKSCDGPLWPLAMKFFSMITASGDGGG